MLDEAGQLWALTRLRDFLREYDELESHPSSDGYDPTVLDGHLAIVKRIVDYLGIDDNLPQLPFENYAGYHHYRSAARQAQALVIAQQEISQHLGGASPSLSTRAMHPWVWDVAEPFWRSGFFSEAIEAAAKNVNKRTQKKAARFDLSEHALTTALFKDDPPKPGEPRLRFPGEQGTQSARSRRNGARGLGVACFAGLRNPKAHEAEILSEYEALEQLAAWSLLARWIDAAVIEGHESDDA